MAKRSKQKILSYSHGMAPTKERQRQNGGTVAEPVHEKNGDKVITRRHRAAFASILDAYLWHDVIGKGEYDAGQKFGREYARSVLKIKVYEFQGGYSNTETSFLSAINGNAVLRQAFDLLTLAQREVAIAVCVENKRAGINRGQELLRKSLAILAREWKMIGVNKQNKKQQIT